MKKAGVRQTRILYQDRFPLSDAPYFLSLVWYLMNQNNALGGANNFIVNEEMGTNILTYVEYDRPTSVSDLNLHNTIS